MNKQITINNKANDTVSPVPPNQQKTRQSITKTTNKKQRIAKKKKSTQIKQQKKINDKQFTDKNKIK